MNQWVKRGDQWLVSCSGEVTEGELVTVTLKDGETRKVLVLKIVERVEGQTFVMAENHWKRTDLVNTWRKVDDEWLIRGRNLREGSSATVHARGDKSSSQVIEKILRTDERGFQWARPVVPLRKKRTFVEYDEHDEWSCDVEAYRTESCSQNPVIFDDRFIEPTDNRWVWAFYK